VFSFQLNPKGFWEPLKRQLGVPFFELLAKLVSRLSDTLVYPVAAPMKSLLWTEQGTLPFAQAKSQTTRLLME